MGKLKDLALVKTANSDSFVYTPPDAAFGAARILIKPMISYPAKPPATVSMPVLEAVFRGLRRACPLGRVVIADGISFDENPKEIFEKLGVIELLDREMRLTITDNLLMENYRNISPEPVNYATLRAPGYIREYDCVITVGAFKKTVVNEKLLISASIHNLLGLLPGDDDKGRVIYDSKDIPVAQLLTDVYFSIGHYFHGAVVDLTEKYVSPDERPDRVRGVAEPVGKVVWGDDMLDVDETACKLAGEGTPDYITEIRRLRKILAKQ